MDTQPKENSEYNLDEAIVAITDMLNEGKQEWRRMTEEMGKIGINLKGLRDSHEKLTARVYQIEDWQRKPFSRSTISIFIAVVDKYFNGSCPCCGEHPILNGAGVKTENFEVDHFKGPKWNKITEGWPICNECHGKLTHGYLSRDGGWVDQAFKSFQMRVRQYTSGLNEDRQQKMF